MSHIRRAAIAAGLVLTAVVAVAPDAGAATVAASATGCAPGAVVREDLYAPSSVALGQPFAVTLVVRNCTGTSQPVTLEGRQTAPGSCSTPVIDPLALTLSPNQRFTMLDQIPGQSCNGVYTITWIVVQDNAVIAHRTRHITIVDNT